MKPCGCRVDDMRAASVLPVLVLGLLGGCIIQSEEEAPIDATTLSPTMGALQLYCEDNPLDRLCTDPQGDTTPSSLSSLSSYELAQTALGNLEWYDDYVQGLQAFDLTFTGDLEAAYLGAVALCAEILEGASLIEVIGKLEGDNVSGLVALWEAIAEQCEAVRPNE